MIIISLVSSGCKGNGSGGIFNPATETPQPSATATLTQTPPPTPTATPEPLALRVNGDGIPLAEYQAQIVQIQAADVELGLHRTASEQSQLAVDELVDQSLLASAAVKAGFELSETELDVRIDKLKSEKGDPAVFATWLENNGYTDLSFRSALRRSIQAAWQRDQILASVPEQAEQVRARQILVRERATAEDILASLQAGSNFSTIAYQYDPSTGGDLGWFPRGYLTQPAVEEAAFSLQPGEFSGIIETNFGFHIIQVVERDPAHPLSPDARLALQKNALNAWLIDQRAAASIENLIP